MRRPSFHELYRRAEKTDAYWTERAILDFTVALHTLMKARGLTKADLARRLGTSPAYLTKVFRGDANFTIASMVRLVRALRGRLQLQVTADEARTQWFDVLETPPPRPHAPAPGDLEPAPVPRKDDRHAVAPAA
jgi:transcriptional regulator with XRE-family HTH domain